MRGGTGAGGIGGRQDASAACGPLGDAGELVAPESLEAARPVVDHLELPWFEPIDPLAPAARDRDDAHLSENRQVLGDGGLGQVEGLDQGGDGLLAVACQMLDDLAAAGLGDGVEGVGMDGGAWHGDIVFRNQNMSSPNRGNIRVGRGLRRALGGGRHRLFLIWPFRTTRIATGTITDA